MDESPAVVRALLQRQDGVVARRQALEAGLGEADVRRMLRGRTWTTLLPGVYVDHTGRPSWTQHAWAAVLATWPAALHGGSALRAYDGPVPGRPDRGRPAVHVAVDRSRSRPSPLDGVVVHQVARLDETVLWNLGPPRQRYADAVLDTAAAAGAELDRVAVLARAAGSRRTTAAQLVAALAQRTRYPRRRWTQDVLRDVAEGTCSVLEHRYLTGVERAHGLPRAERQRREAGVAGVVYRDVTLGAAVVELDGRLHHDDPLARDLDLERDLDVAASGRTTVRLGWGQVLDRPCRTAAKVAAFLRQHGVEAYARPCGPGCPAGLAA
ncbi:hypothetical protein ENKNEFLB_04253 [Nocardioides aquaticus]|uniref:Transcriptional regulator, AbiEi antitoxin, Type IV TA system n=1 Tax=Nocardioides aquaticus TaxID=160826 RepID=A0ABX8EP98_9ACTN|nr:hypothetical protein [Nocardioides aquaticus]QVT81835.1 hypothetical protein ENKNEFLB_04253 [Nocardioides aquaticus]